VNYGMKIAGTGSYVPPNKVDNESLSKFSNVDPHWVYEKLGIKARHFSNNETTSDFALVAARNALDKARITPEELGLIIVATITPDRQTPSTACILHQKLGLFNTPAFDIAAACSGFLYGLTIGSQFIETGMYKNVLVVGADRMSSLINFEARDACFFGDGAGAVVLTRSEESSKFRSTLHADGSGKDVFTVYPDQKYFSMDAKGVAQIALDVLPETIHNFLQKNEVPLEDINWVIPHQPSKSLLKTLSEKVGICFTKFKTNMDKYANTSAATIPLLLDEVAREHKDLKPGDKILFVAIGVGMTWGCSLYQWQ